MDIDVSINNESMTISIEDPHKYNPSKETIGIINFGQKCGVDVSHLEIESLIPRMIRGVAGCEGGCPSDAKSLIRQGFGDFKLSYIEGGILSADCSLEGGKSFSVKIFPEFD